MSASKPRLRAPIEAGNFFPRGSAVGLSPNISSSAYAQQTQQNNTFFIAADSVSGTTSTVNCPANSFTTAANLVVPFSNIPIAQGINPTSLSPFKTNQAAAISPTGSTSLLFRVHTASLTSNLGVIISSFSLTPHVTGDNNLVYTGSYLNPGNYRQFGALLTVLVYNPTGSTINGITINYTITGDLSAGYPDA